MVKKLKFLIKENMKWIKEIFYSIIATKRKFLDELHKLNYLEVERDLSKSEKLRRLTMEKDLNDILYQEKKMEIES